MAGTEILYQHQFYDYNGQLVVIYIVQPGYSGATTFVTAGPSPITIEWMGEGEDKFTHVKGSSASIQFVSQTWMAYLDLFLAKNRSYRVLVYRDGGRIWDGWINPEYYSEPFISPPYVTTITATDGLVLLKNIPFPIPTDFKNSLIYYLATALNLIGLPDSMRIRVACDFYATTTTDGTVTDRILEKLFIDYRSMRDGADMWKAYDVVESILQTLNARLYQYGGAWWIERIDHKINAVDVNVYEMDGTYSSTLSSQDYVVPLTDNLGIGSTLRFLNGANLEVQPAYKDYTIKHEWGSRTNILTFNNFDGEFYEDEWTSDTELENWVRTSGAEDALVEKTEFENSIVCKLLPISYPSTVPSHTAYITHSNFIWTYDEGATDETGFSTWLYSTAGIHFEISCFLDMAYNPYAPDQYFKQYVKLYANYSGNIYVLWCEHNGTSGSLETYEWVKVGDPDPIGKIAEFQINLNQGEWIDVEQTFYPPHDEQGNAQTYIGFKVDISSPDYRSEDYSDSGNLIRRVKLYFVDTEDQIYNNKGEKEAAFEETDVHTIDTDNLLSPPDYEFKFGNTPAPYGDDGYGLVNRYVLFDSDNNAVNKFGSYSLPPLYTLPFVLRFDFAPAYRRPQFKLKGTVIDAIGAELGFNSILKDYDYRYYFPTGLSYEMKTVQWSGEWMQCGEDTEAGTGEFNNDFNEDFWI